MIFFFFSRTFWRILLLENQLAVSIKLQNVPNVTHIQAFSNKSLIIAELYVQLHPNAKKKGSLDHANVKTRSINTSPRKKKRYPYLSHEKHPVAQKVKIWLYTHQNKNKTQVRYKRKNTRKTLQKTTEGGYTQSKSCSTCYIYRETREVGVHNTKVCVYMWASGEI